MEYISEFKLAKTILFEMGQLINQKDNKSVLSSIGKDIKLALDIEIDNLVVKKLSQNYTHPILSEENGLNKQLIEQSPYWILDPIDGSMNLIRGIPHSCISLALWIGQDPIFGVIYNYNHNEMVSGYIDQGAWLNDSAIYEVKPVAVNQSILATGIPKDMDFSEKNAMNFIQKLNQYKKIRMFGSAAISLSYVALGRVDAYFEQNIKLWDVAAGIAILKALNKTPHQYALKENYLVDLEISN